MPTNCTAVRFSLFFFKIQKVKTLIKVYFSVVSPTIHEGSFSRIGTPTNIIVVYVSTAKDGWNWLWTTMVFMLTCVQEDKVSNFSSPENRQLLGELSGIDTLLQCLSVSCFSCKLQASDILMFSLRLFNHKHSDSNTICTWVLVISHFKMPLHQATVVATYLIAKLMFPQII